MAYSDYTSRGAVAVITLKNPPVNALNVGLRAAIADGVERAIADESIRAVVIVGSGSAFCGGADVSEFGLSPPSGRNSVSPRSSSAFCRVRGVRSGSRAWWGWSGRST